MKKINLLFFLILFTTITVSVFSMPVSNLNYYTTDNWSVNFRIPFTDNLGIDMSLNNGQPYLGVVVFNSWEEFSE
ncbi:MAG: hypothetical protein ACOC80_02395 [Petrotogales bacterium]